MKKKNKFYVVWKGYETGVFTTWEECFKQINGFAGALYKSFENLTQAQKAYAENPKKFFNKKNCGYQTEMLKSETQRPVLESISVDAACDMTKGIMEYQGVYTKTGKILFKKGPYKDGTNNIGEFLALVHGLAYCKKNNTSIPIYSDSATAMAWVRKKKAATKQALTDNNEELFELIERAERWLHNNTWENPILKWRTDVWGEIPADFGRK